MAKFTFRLATLLRLREATRDERRTQLAQAYRADEILETEQGRVAGQIGQLREQSRQAAAPGVVDIDRLLEARRYELVLQSQGQDLAAQRQAVRVEIERRQEALVDANRQVRVLETLREKQLDRHRQEENRQEIKELDETAGRSGPKEDEP